MRFSTGSEFVKYCDDLRLGPAEWMKDVLKANYACAKDPVRRGFLSICLHAR